jgi:hypothetical protein
MRLRLVLTTHLSADQMAPYWPGIIACLEKYCARYPHDESVDNIIRQCAAGRRQLWMVLDEKDEVVLAPVTEIVTVDATGAARFVFVEVGGSRAREAMPLITEMEAWARAQGCTEFDFVGRRGWERLLAPYGYRPEAVIYRKRIPHAEGQHDSDDNAAQ